MDYIYIYYNPLNDISAMGSKNNITIEAHEIPGFVDGFSMVFPSGSVLPRGT
jgi:hypothetical protein